MNNCLLKILPCILIKFRKGRNHYLGEAAELCKQVAVRLSKKYEDEQPKEILSHIHRVSLLLWIKFQARQFNSPQKNCMFFLGGGGGMAIILILKANNTQSHWQALLDSFTRARDKGLVQMTWQSMEWQTMEMAQTTDCHCV